MHEVTTDTVVSGLCYPETPRWHDGHVWVSDQYDQAIVEVDPLGGSRVAARFDDSPSGLGWLDDGTLLAVLMHAHSVVRVADGSASSTFANLDGLHGGPTNDMVVAGDLIYVGNIGFDFYAGEDLTETPLFRLDPAGEVSIAADGLVCPNGMAISPDRTRLYVAESLAGRISSFRIGADGSLYDRAVFAELPGLRPDGICLDADGAIWAACARTPDALRVAEGGEILATARSENNHVYACTLGGADRRTLFLCTSPTDIAEEAVERREGAVEACVVEVPGVGWN